MMKKIIHFVQYHNFFSIAVMFVFVGASVSFAASPQLRQSVLAKTEMARSVDNSFIINTDLDTYDIGLKIQSVTEDTDKYYIGYTYNLVDVKDYVWQPIPTADSMKVSKKELAGRDLGLYVAGQLGQVVDHQIAYLKEVQKKEKKTGVTQKIVAVEYSGLVGQFLSTDEKAFEGYTPVVTPVPAEVVSEQLAVSDVAPAAVGAAPDAGNTVYPAPVQSSAPVLTRDEVNALIQYEVRRLLADSTSSPQAGSVQAQGSQTSPPPAPTPLVTEPAPPASPQPSPEAAAGTAEATQGTAPEPEPAPEVIAEPVPAPEPEPTPVPEPTPALPTTEGVGTPTESVGAEPAPETPAAPADAPAS